MTACPGHRIAVVIGAQISIIAGNRLSDDALTVDRIAVIGAQVAIGAAYDSGIKTKQYANIFRAEVAIFAGGVVITRLASEYGNPRANRAVANIVNSVYITITARSSV